MCDQINTEKWGNFTWFRGKIWRKSERVKFLKIHEHSREKATNFQKYTNSDGKGYWFSIISRLRLGFFYWSSPSPGFHADHLVFVRGFGSQTKFQSLIWYSMITFECFINNKNFIHMVRLRYSKYPESWKIVENDQHFNFCRLFWAKKMKSSKIPALIVLKHHERMLCTDS